MSDPEFEYALMIPESQIDWSQLRESSRGRPKTTPFARLEKMARQTDIERLPQSSAQWAKTQTMPKPVRVCVNCDGMFIPPSQQRTNYLYCRTECRQMAWFIRTCRTWVRSPVKQADHGWDEVFYIYLTKFNALAMHGYYHSHPSGSQMPAWLRKAVIERDKVCVQCGDPGDHIDHICGGENTLENLQYLCAPCNVGKSIMDVEHPLLTRKEAERVKALRAELCERIDAPQPLRACDNEVMWESYWRKWPNVEQVEYTGRAPGKHARDIVYRAWLESIWPRDEYGRKLDKSVTTSRAKELRTFWVKACKALLRR